MCMIITVYSDTICCGDIAIGLYRRPSYVRPRSAVNPIDTGEVVKIMVAYPKGTNKSLLSKMSSSSIIVVNARKRG
jgi:hypothetical protein